MPKKNLFVVMGVSGTGKTTIGKLLAKALSLPFFDGDDYHPQENISKMASGRSLDDDDRKGWLENLNNLIISNEQTGAILACSSLKQSYRDILSKGLHRKLHFVFLNGTFDEVKSRIEQRKGHFMPLELLTSQFETLERPKDCIEVSIMDSPSNIIEHILTQV